MTTPPNARAQVQRLLTLVPMLHARGALRLTEAAGILGVPVDQVLADLKVLFLCGLPGGYPDDLIDVDLDALEGEDGDVHDDGLIRVENADYLARPLQLTPIEASAIVVALRALREGSPPETAVIVDRVLAKLEDATARTAPATDAARVDLGDLGDVRDRRAVPASADTLVADLERAVGERRQVRLRYFVPSRDEVTDRVVDPRGLVVHDGRRYLDAWCHRVEDERLFRLDRIEDAVVLESPIPTAAEAPRDLSRGLFRQADQASTATLRLAPSAHWIVEYYPVLAVRDAIDASVDGSAEGALDVDLVVADPAWLHRLVLRLAPHAEVLAPAEFIESSRAVTQRTLGLYS